MDFRRLSKNHASSHQNLWKNIKNTHILSQFIEFYLSMYKKDGRKFCVCGILLRCISNLVLNTFSYFHTLSTAFKYFELLLYFDVIFYFKSAVSPGRNDLGTSPSIYSLASIRTPDTSACSTTGHTARAKLLRCWRSWDTVCLIRLVMLCLLMTLWYRCSA